MTKIYIYIFLLVLYTGLNDNYILIINNKEYRPVLSIDIIWSVFTSHDFQKEKESKNKSEKKTNSDQSSMDNIITIIG